MTRAGPVDELIAKTPDWRGAMLAKLRKIVHDADPEMAEDVKWKRPSNPLGSAVWSHDGQVCVGIILKERVGHDRLRVQRQRHDHQSGERGRGAAGHDVEVVPARDVHAHGAKD